MTGQQKSASGTPRRVHVIRDGLAAHLPDIDPEETAEWLDSFDAVLDAAGQHAPATSCCGCCSAPASATSACRR